MTELEFIVQVEQQYREKVLYPELAQKANPLRELRRMQLAEAGPRRRRPARWAGDRLVTLGDRLIRAGQRLSPPRQETPLRPG